MQTRTLLAAIATAAVAATATPSFSNAQQPTTSKGEVAMAPSFGSLISAINSSSMKNDKIKAMTDVSASNVQLVNVEDLLKGNDVKALESALKKNEEGIKTLRGTLGTNPTINSAITDTTANPAKLTTNDVVAADVAPNGKVIVYYWKKA